ncbi:non-specific lipid transfer protein GPI-anchored 30 [Gastrolobium bilobum]|uniref:non-specific lipid transfer protein GPI-anchored 30 n=1 Tax=Gastrolobium bilobum TaxID=150636 RepID=UPI002AAF6C77|nr:non-specific lipid transfer protein GPI-anchored 30 [Gastrolobium bilobum]
METKLRALSYIVFLVLVTWISRGRAQDSTCLNKLAPCLRYLNGTQDVPDSCCDPLKSVIESDSKCLCSLVSNKGTRQAEEAGVNINEAQNLPGRCGQHVNPLSCLTNSPGSSNSDQNSATKLMLVTQGFIMISALSIIAHI